MKILFLWVFSVLPLVLSLMHKRDRTASRRCFSPFRIRIRTSRFSPFILCDFTPVNVCDRVPKPAKSELIAGIDPGLINVVATDHGALYNPSKTTAKIKLQIAKLQQKLAQTEERNDVRFGRNRNNRKEKRTKNEQKLYDRIARLHEKAANSTRAFNQKLSTRLARTYGTIIWEDSSVKEMTKQLEAVPNATGYEHTGAEYKTGLNRMFANNAIADLRELTKQKVELRQGKFILVPAANTTQTCHCCQQVLKEPISPQSPFYCENPKCEVYNKEQHPDVNAAKYIKFLGLT